MGNWSELPSELLEAIALRVYSANFVDYIRFRVVCKPWRSIFVRKPTHLPPHSPLIMITSLKDAETRTFFYPFANNNLGKLNHFGTLIRQLFSRGYGHGWQVMMDKTDGIYLENPITQNKICLPHLSTLASTGKWFMTPEMGILKAVISSHPTLDNNGDDCTIMAIIGLERTGKTKLAFCKLGDQKWSAIQDDEEREFEDLSYCNGRLYALDESSEAIVVCNIGPSLGVRQIAVQPESYSEDGSNYLIEFCGDLLHLQVKWCYEDGGRISGFKFFRLEQNNQTWSEVKSLGDYSLFLEFRGSISLLASDHPGVKPNCIYFLEYTNELLCVVFSLDNCSFEYFSVDTGCRITVVSLWVTPSLW